MSLVFFLGMVALNPTFFPWVTAGNERLVCFIKWVKATLAFQQGLPFDIREKGTWGNATIRA